MGFAKVNSIRKQLLSLQMQVRAANDGSMDPLLYSFVTWNDLFNDSYGYWYKN